MNITFFVIILFIYILIRILYWLLTGANEESNEEYPYYKNPNFMTDSEKSFFRLLQNILGDKYYVCSQVGLISLLKISERGREWWVNKGKLGQKSVDFVLLDKQTLDPKIVIELDDSSHLLPSRQERDEFVEKALKVAGIRLVRIKNQSSYDVKNLEKEIFSKIT